MTAWTSAWRGRRTDAVFVQCIASALGAQRRSGVLFLVACAIFARQHPNAFGVATITTNANQGAALAGFFNGLLVVRGRIQPVIATLATGAIFYGAALG